MYIFFSVKSLTKKGYLNAGPALLPWAKFSFAGKDFIFREYWNLIRERLKTDSEEIREVYTMYSSVSSLCR